MASWNLLSRVSGLRAGSGSPASRTPPAQTSRMASSPAPPRLAKCLDGGVELMRACWALRLLRRISDSSRGGSAPALPATPRPSLRRCGVREAPLSCQRGNELSCTNQRRRLRRSLLMNFPASAGAARYRVLGQRLTPEWDLWAARAGASQPAWQRAAVLLSLQGSAERWFSACILLGCQDDAEMVRMSVVK